MTDPITDEQYEALELRLMQRKEFRRQLDAVLTQIRELQERRVDLECMLRLSRESAPVTIKPEAREKSNATVGQ
jgi:cobyrinic acid a,c-diamide synthase